MVRPTVSSAIPLLMLAKLAAGIGCNTHSFTTCDDGIVHWYDPEDGQICDPLDCGGGRAPPKKSPGCAGYTGTEVRTISYLSCWKDFATVGFTSAAEPTTEAGVETETDVEADTQPAETESSESSESSPSTITAVDSSTATSVVVTTSAATLSTRTQTSAEDETSTTEEETNTGEASRSAAGTEASTAGSEASTAENEATTPTNTPNAGQILRGSIVAVFGFAVGVLTLA